MSTEEKAKAYDDALKRAKAAIDIAADKDLVGGVVRTILPELAESEDERIRKELIYSLRSPFIKENLTDEKVAPWLEWLEKQEEQKPAEWSEDYREEDIQTRFAFYTYKDDPSVLYLSNVFVEKTSRNHGFGTRILKAAEKVAEAIGAITICLKVKQDSPANAWYRKHGYGYVAFEDGYDWLEKNLEYIKPKKSIKWSGDDELMIESLIAYLKGTGQDFISNDMVYWLKSLPERFNLQPKQEWSEEDKEKLKAICTYLRDYSRLAKLGDKLRFNEYCDFLKSLRPSWKPSDEQMSALLWCIAHLGGADRRVLAELYEHLKMYCK